MLAASTGTSLTCSARELASHTYSTPFQHYCVNKPALGTCLRLWEGSCASNIRSRRRNAQASSVTKERREPNLDPATSVKSPSLKRRRLILLRHARSSWDNPNLRDHDRPLDKHGQEAAQRVAGLLQEAGWLPQLVLCSDSVRTRQTLDLMQSQVAELQQAEVRFLGSYYTVAAMDGQTAHHLEETISQYARVDVDTVMVMGHNKGWEEAASEFSGKPVELQTANAALLEAFGNSWEKAFASAGLGGWELHGLVKPDGEK